MNTFIIVLVVILVIIFIFHKTYFEEFKNNTSPVTILVFVSKSCGHCVNYNKQMHNEVADFANSNKFEYKRIFADDDKDNLFDKHNIQYVPASVILKGDEIKKIDGSINTSSIQSAISSI